MVLQETFTKHNTTGIHGKAYRAVQKQGKVKLPTNHLFQAISLCMIPFHSHLILCHLVCPNICDVLDLMRKGNAFHLCLGRRLLNEQVSWMSAFGEAAPTFK